MDGYDSPAVFEPFDGICPDCLVPMEERLDIGNAFWECRSCGKSVSDDQKDYDVPVQVEIDDDVEL
jgi:ribosomal protein L37AE/L43A